VSDGIRDKNAYLYSMRYTGYYSPETGIALIVREGDAPGI
jgi:hypothetical protein